MKLKQYQKNLVSALIIVIGGFVLFNLAFILAALTINITISILGIAENEAPPLISRLVYVILIIIIFWFVFRSRLSDTMKATFLTMPLMVILVATGIAFYQQSKWIIGGISGVIISLVLLYLYKKRLSWVYYFATVYVAILAGCILLFNIQI